MFGFGKKKKAAEPASYTLSHEVLDNGDVVGIINAPIDKVAWCKEFVQASTFKGCKRYKLKHVDVDGAADTLALYRPAFKFKDCPIMLERVDTYKGQDLDGSKIKIYVDGRIIGLLPDYKPEDIEALSARPYDKVHVRVEESYHDDGSVMGQNVYLFIRFTDL